MRKIKEINIFIADYKKYDYTRTKIFYNDLHKKLSKLYKKLYKKIKYVPNLQSADIMLLNKNSFYGDVSKDLIARIISDCKEIERPNKEKDLWVLVISPENPYMSKNDVESYKKCNADLVAFYLKENAESIISESNSNNKYATTVANLIKKYYLNDSFKRT